MTGRSLQVARGLNTIAARLVKNQGTLAQYGISLTDANGQMRSTFDILQDLSKIWKNLDDVERTNLGNTLAGINQYKVLAAVMTNFESAIEANQTAIEAQGSAAKENARYMESYEAKINGLKAAFQNLSIAVIDGDAIKGVLGGITQVVQGLADSEFGSGLITTLLFGTAGWAGMQKLMNLQWLGAIGSQFKNLATLVSYTAGGAGTFAESLALVGGASGVALPAILGVVGGIVALGAAYKDFKQGQYEKSYEGITEAMSDTDDALANITADISKYERNMGSLTESEKAYLDVLKDRQKILLEDRAEKQQASWEALGKKAKDAMTDIRVVTDETGEIASSEKYNKAADAFDGLINSVRTGMSKTAQYKKDVQDYVSAYGELADTLEEANKQGRAYTKEEERLVLSVAMARNELKELNGTLDENESGLEENSDGWQTVAQSIGRAATELEKFNSASSVNLSANMGGYQSAFQAFQKDMSAGRYGSATVSAAVDLFIPQEVQAQLGYDSAKIAELLSTGMVDGISTAATKLYKAADPLSAMNDYIYEHLDANREWINSDGKVIASVTETGKVCISSYSDIAKEANTTTEAIKSIFDASQELGHGIAMTQEEMQNFISALEDIVGAGNVTADNLPAVAEAIAQTVDSADPSTIRDYIDALIEAGAIPPVTNELIVEAIDKATPTFKKIEGEFNAIPTAKTSTITAAGQSSGTSWGTLLGWFNSLYDKTVTITTREVRSGSGGRFAKGTDNFQGGLALVNDGAPVNGSSAELIVDDGRAFIAGNGEETVVGLNKGAVIYTAAETQKILKNTNLAQNSLTQGIGAYASGAGGAGFTFTQTGGGGGGYVDSSPQVANIATDDAKKMKEEFDKWLKAKKHALAMDEITEAEYYRDLEAMNEKYLANREEYLDDYWQHQEEIYRYQKQDLQDIITLEENLNELAKAKTQKVLVYKDGMFQYVQNTEAIAKAQRAVDGQYASGTTSANGGLSLVGEKGAELRVLNRGDGIIPADITRNLMQLGSLSLDKLPFGNNSTDIFNIGEVNLENVNNVEDIFSGLKNLALQKASSRM